MKLWLIMFLSITGATAIGAVAQPRPQPSDADRSSALTGKLQDELNTEMELRTMLVQMQRQMTGLQKENADLKAKCGKPCEAPAQK